MHILTLIPSRMASTRLPNKPLADLGGKPMIVRVLEQAQKANYNGPAGNTLAFNPVVAAGDAAIVEAVEAHGGRAILTDADLPSGSDRIWQATQRLMAKGEPRPDIIINVQGDEPVLPPEMLETAVNLMTENPNIDVLTFAHDITHPKELNDPGMVKAVTDATGRALYFSRSLIPHSAATAKRHIGFYAYRTAALEKFVATPPSPLELQEKLEQLRGMELGLHYHVAMTDAAPIGVDTAEDLAKVRELYS